MVISIYFARPVFDPPHVCKLLTCICPAVLDASRFVFSPPLSLSPSPSRPPYTSSSSSSSLRFFVSSFPSSRVVLYISGRSSGSNGGSGGERAGGRASGLRISIYVTCLIFSPHLIITPVFNVQYPIGALPSRHAHPRSRSMSVTTSTSTSASALPYHVQPCAPSTYTVHVCILT